jgi:hypothetical protein
MRVLLGGSSVLNSDAFLKALGAAAAAAAAAAGSEPLANAAAGHVWRHVEQHQGPWRQPTVRHMGAATA